jgi:hypothetical protein
MTKLTASLLAASFAVIAAPALAADLPAKVAPTAKAAAPAPTTTIGIELSPEIVANPTSPDLGKVTDYYLKGTVTEIVAPGWTVAGFLQGTEKILNTPNTQQYQVEADVAYKAKLNDNLSVTITGGLGYTWGNTGYLSPTSTNKQTGNDPFLYYVLQGAADWKIDSHWTWNVISVRYRNAFDRTWLTPKVQTGITYNINSTSAVYATVGYAWKDQGDGKGLNPDKWNVAVGYKFSF